MKTFKILGLLLTYPQEVMHTHADELIQELKQEQLLSQKQNHSLQAFIARHMSMDLLSWQEQYVETFDRGRAHCLHLFEHVHGESRDRGQAMVDLAEMYATKGLMINQAELPDYLPLFLEYLSLCPFEEAKQLLGEAVHVITSIGAKLKKRNNDYHVIFDILQALSEVKADAKIIAAAEAAVQAEDHSMQALDKEWEEVEAFSGDSPLDACNRCNTLNLVEEHPLHVKAGGIK